MFILKKFIKRLIFFLTRPLLLFLAFAVALILRWYFWGGLFAAIFIGIIVFFVSIFILAIKGVHNEKLSEDDKSETYIEEDEDGTNTIQSKIPTAIISRHNGKNTNGYYLTT